MGNETSLIAPDGKHIQATVTFQPISAHPLLPLPAGKPLQKKLVVLRNAMIRLQNLYRLRRSLKRQHPDLVFFACLDDMLPTLAPLWLQELKEKAQGRKVVSLLGSINFRKGIKLLLESIPLLPEEDYFFLIAGKSSLTAQQENDLQTFEKSRSNCLFSLEKIPDESCFNALIAESDLIFAAYKQFTGSSNLLTKAAAFHKPVIVSRGFCMGQRVEQARPPEKTMPENAAQLSVRCVAKQRHPSTLSTDTPTNTLWRN